MVPGAPVDREAAPPPEPDNDPTGPERVTFSLSRSGSKDGVTFEAKPTRKAFDNGVVVVEASSPDKKTTVEIRVPHERATYALARPGTKAALRVKSPLLPGGSEAPVGLTIGGIDVLGGAPNVIAGKYMSQMLDDDMTAYTVEGEYTAYDFR